MKKLTKLIFSCAAVAAVTASVCTSAFAELEATIPLVSSGVDSAISGTYDTATGKFTITNYEGTGTEQTILIYKGAADETNVTDTMIEYINQKTVAADADKYKDEASLMTMAVEPAEGQPDTVYTIRIGGDNGAIRQATLTIPAAGGSTEPGGDTVTAYIGDVNLSAVGKPNPTLTREITADDSKEILSHLVNTNHLTDTQLKVAFTVPGGESLSADVLRSVISIGDATNILTYVGARGAADADYANVGNAITITAPAAE